MKETIIKFTKGPFPKKYTAHLQNKKTKKKEYCILVTDVINNIAIELILNYISIITIILVKECKIIF